MEHVCVYLRYAIIINVWIEIFMLQTSVAIGSESMKFDRIIFERSEMPRKKRHKTTTTTKNSDAENDMMCMCLSLLCLIWSWTLYFMCSQLFCQHSVWNIIIYTIHSLFFFRCFVYRTPFCLCHSSFCPIVVKLCIPYTRRDNTLLCRLVCISNEREKTHTPKKYGKQHRPVNNNENNSNGMHISFLNIT